jgi:hypothetical protein
MPKITKLFDFMAAIIISTRLSQLVTFTLASIAVHWMCHDRSQIGSHLSPTPPTTHPAAIRIAVFL